MKDQLDATNSKATHQYEELKGEMVNINRTLALLLAAVNLSACIHSFILHGYLTDGLL
jgi:hypothetical protein